MFLTLTILIFTLSQFGEQQLGFVNILLVTHANTWTECTTYSIAAGINITIAAIAYVSIQKPYVLQKYGRTTFMEESEYWTVKSLFGAACSAPGYFSLLSIVNAIQSTIMDVDMIWLAGTFIVGNLYTLSILLTVQSDLTAITAYTVGSMAPEARSDRGSVAHCSSTATLTNDSALWEDIVKAQTTKAALNPVSKQGVTTSAQESEVGQIKYDLGYGKIAAV
ncbi:hypothetical protein BD311DRAFT_775767 [Dichomitus squalens]|uniref:Uncharacterized protein n=1 Tax=Dichomitus squalens TaxID=114155 RepID=A0A4Q9MV08_9APHY|nr:hypothetical protein BD311DRAFT_775767 [Dichomitus squalens]